MNTEEIIDHINRNPKRLETAEYKDYLRANYEVSAQLSELIGSFVDYGKSKEKFGYLGRKLELR